MRFEDDRQLTARGKASATRSEAWLAWEAAVRDTIKAIPLGDGYPVELGVIGTGCRPWWELQITTDYPELREEQETIFRETGKSPNALDLGLVKPPAKGYDRTTVLKLIQSFQEESGLPVDKFFVEGVAALVLCGVVENARPEDKEVEVSVFVKDGETLHVNPPEGVVVTQVFENLHRWRTGQGFVRDTALQVRHPQVVLKEHERTGKKGYLMAIRNMVFCKA